MEEIILEKILLQYREKPIFVAIHGPQGCGKSTSCKNVKKKLQIMGLRVLIMSLDDFYYPHEKLQQLFFEFNDELYKYRGLAGTHDTQLLYHCLDKLQKGENVLIPKYNKTLNNGLGDIEEFIPHEGKFDVVLFEGWMIGYKPRKYIPHHLRRFNFELEKYQNLKNYFDLWIYFDTHIKNVYKWRYSAEKTMDIDTFNEFMKPYFVIYSNYLICAKNNVYYLNKKREILKNDNRTPN